MVLLNPVWVMRQMFSLVTANPSRLTTLPADVVKHGILRHDIETLSQVWPETPKEDLHVLLQLSHDLHVAFSVNHGGETFSLVPDMAPYEGVEPGRILMGVAWSLPLWPTDLWRHVVYRLRRLVVPGTLRRSSFQLGGDTVRATVSCVANKKLEIVVHGAGAGVGVGVDLSSLGIELMTQAFWSVQQTLADMYPLMDLEKVLYVMCHECQCESQLYGRPWREALDGKKFFVAIVWTWT